MKKDNIQEQEKIVVVFDIDGVIADYSTKTAIIKSRGLSALKMCKLYDLIFKSLNGEKIINHFYRKRIPNKNIINLISELKENGCEIVLITAFLDKKLAEEELKKHGVEYHYLFVRKEGESVIKYKIDKIKKLGAKIVVDDLKEVIDALPSGIKGIYYKITKKRLKSTIITEIRVAVYNLIKEREIKIEIVTERAGEGIKKKRNEGIIIRKTNSEFKIR